MTIDGRPLGQVVLPIRLALDRMEGLLFATFKGDPEFEGIEPQVFDDPVNGRGMRVLRYRKDRKIDVYYQAGVQVDRTTFAVGAGIGDFVETTIDPARFEINERGVDLHVAFMDVQGRRVELRVLEETHGKRGFPMLAPVGADVEKPPRLLLVYMPTIDLVRRSGSLVEGHIGDRTLRPASLPVLLNWRRVWFVRHVSRPVIAALNPPMSIPVLIKLSAPGSAEVEGMTVVADEHGKVTRISTGQPPCLAQVDFLPGFPNLLDLADGGSAAGHWSIQIAGVLITGGLYRVSRKDDRVAIELDVTRRWKPSRLPLSMEIFTRLVPVFRAWPTTYRWRGVVELGTAPAMTGAWKRKGRR